MGARMLLGAIRGIRGERRRAPRWGGGAGQPGRGVSPGLLTNLSNPKIVLFFAAVLSQFMPVSAPAWVQLVYIAALLVTSVLWFRFIAITVSRRSSCAGWCRRGRGSICGGVVFAGLGVSRVAGRGDADLIASPVPARRAKGRGRCGGPSSSADPRLPREPAPAVPGHVIDLGIPRDHPTSSPNRSAPRQDPTLVDQLLDADARRRDAIASVRCAPSAELRQEDRRGLKEERPALLEGPRPAASRTPRTNSARPRPRCTSCR